MLLAIIVVSLVAPTALMALALGVGLAPLPYQLFVVKERLPVLFSVHMIASALALIALPIAIRSRRRRAFHRAVGRFGAACVAIGGTSALAVALASEATLMARAGLFAQGAVWLLLLGAAYIAIRRREVARHARLMLATAAVTSGAIWLRFVVAGGIAVGLPFNELYAVATWACWLVPLGLTIAAAPRLQRWALTQT